MKIVAVPLKPGSEILYFVEEEGDPYPQCVVVEPQSLNEVEVKGVDKVLTLKHARLLKQLAKERGVTLVKRKRNNRLLTMRLNK